MARPRGVRNPDFEEKRSRLIDALTDFVLSTDLKRASLRQFAQAASVSEPTLRHYFGDRTGVVRAIMTQISERTAARFEEIESAEDSELDYPEALQSSINKISANLTSGTLARAHLFGIIEGAADKELARTYLSTILEPSLRRVETQFEKFHATDNAESLNPRVAAFMLQGPVLLAGLHQHMLGGRTFRPLDLQTAFANWGEALTRAFPKAPSE